MPLYFAIITEKMMNIVLQIGPRGGNSAQL